MFSLNRVLLVSVLLGASVASQPQSPRLRAMAITIDDLPYVHGAVQGSLEAAQRGTTRLLAVLNGHHAQAVGFVYEGKLHAGGELEGVALLQQWVDAGMTLGNHTYSHPDFNRRTIDEFKDEIVKGDAISRRLMQRRGPHQLYFRHPMTHTGDTKEKKPSRNSWRREATK